MASTAAELAATRAATDVLILPRLDGVEIRNWKAFEPALAAGYEAATGVVSGLAGPITHIRARAEAANARDAEASLPALESSRGRPRKGG